MDYYYQIEPKAKLRYESYTIVKFSNGKLESLTGNSLPEDIFRITPSGRVRIEKNFNFYKISEEEAKRLKMERDRRWN